MNLRLYKKGREIVKK